MGLDNLLQEYNDSNKRMQELFSEGLKREVQAIFDSSPDLENFSWIQYTPYFADGDPCEFSVHADMDYGLRVNGEYLDDHYNDNEWKNKWTPTLKQLSKLLNSVPDEIMQNVYGDHVEIIVNRDGTYRTERYDHD